MIQIYVDLGKEKNQKPVRKDGRFFWEGMLSLKFYTEQFEVDYLHRTSLYFRAKALKLIREENCESYLQKVDAMITKEHDLADDWLQAKTTEMIHKIIADELVTDMAQQVIEKPNGFVTFITEKKFDSLRLLCKVFSIGHEDCLNHICSQL